MNDKADLHMIIEYEQFLPRILHQILNKVLNKPRNRRFVPITRLCRNCKAMFSFIGKEHFQATAAFAQVS
jgi:hypothetical protein